MLNVLDYKQPIFQHGKLNVWPFQLKRNPDLIASMLRYREGNARRVYARSLDIVEVSSSDAVLFLEKNHLSGSASGASFRYGLSDGSRLLMLITLGKPRYAKNFSLEVLRLATERDFAVVGGASKLFRHVLHVHAGKSILSYSDKLLGDGNVYKACGFRYLGETKPGYFWEKDGAVISRYQTQKHKLQSLLGVVDLSLSERAIMTAAGWQHVRDNGNIRWGLGEEDLSHANEKRFNYLYKITRPQIDDAYYIGVHSTDNLEDNYLGSGHLVTASVLKYGREAHKRQIIEMYESRAEAFIAEAAAVNRDTLLDPNCMNLCLGGGSPVLPNGSTNGRVSIWHISGQERRVNQEELSIFTKRGWKIGRHPDNKKDLHGAWYIRDDGTHGRTSGELPETAQFGRRGVTDGYRWVTRDGRQQLVSQIKDGDVVGFTQSKTNKGGKVLSHNGERRVVSKDEFEKLQKEGWQTPTSPTTGRIGMRSPDGIKKLVFPDEARKLYKEGWTLATKQLKSAPPHVLEFAQEIGMTLPKKRK